MSPRSRLAALAVGALASSTLAITLFAGTPAAPTVSAAPMDAARPATGGTGLLPSTRTPTPAWTPYGHGAGRRPNILMITSDDLSTLDLRYMPHVRKLIGRQGVTFANAVAPTPICVPARASLLTGQYAHNHGARTISGPHGGFASFGEGRTVPVALQRAGYDTLFTGKYLNGYGQGGSLHYVPPGWTDWRGTVDPSTYNFFAPHINHNGRLTTYHRYTTYVMRDQANAMLSAKRRAAKPWFMWVNYVAPHHGGPVQSEDPSRRLTGWAKRIKTTVPAPQDRHRYDGVPLPKRPDMFQVPTGAPKHSPSRTHRWSAYQKKALRAVYDQRIEAAQAVDRAVASHVRKLRQIHQLSRTIIIFGSDNGYAAGEHNINGKLFHYDSILRIPLLMRGPRIPKGRTVGTVVTNPDIATTILAAAGARPLRAQDGVNILPWLRSGTQWRVTPLEGWAVQNGNRRVYAGVRVGPWTYVRLGRNGRGGEELYNRAHDPYELHSLAHQQRYARTLAQLRRLTTQYEHCQGSSCPKAFYRA